MKKFMDEDFLLSTQTAQKLYHEHAEKTPILDYHCHINPEGSLAFWKRIRKSCKAFKRENLLGLRYE